MPAAAMLRPKPGLHGHAPLQKKPPMMLSRATSRVVAAMSLTLACTAVGAVPMGYVVNSDSPNDQTTDSLYRIDLATGSTTLLGRPGTFFTDIEGLALNFDGALLGIDDGSKSLILLDTANGVAAPFGGTRGNLSPTVPLGANNADPSIVITCDGQLLAATAQTQGSSVTSNLFRLDGQSGRPTQIASGLPVLTDLAARGNSIYGLGFDRLYLVDPGNGTATAVGSFGSGLFSQGGGLAFDADGQLWAIADQSQSEGLSRIYRINPFTGAATDTGKTTLTGVESLAIAPTQCNGPSGQPLVEQIPASSAVSLTSLIGVLGLFGALSLLRRRG